MSNCNSKCIKKALTGNVSLIIISMGVGMAAGVGAGMIIKSVLSKEESTGKKLLSIGLSSLSDMIEGLSSRL